MYLDLSLNPSRSSSLIGDSYTASDPTSIGNATPIDKPARKPMRAPTSVVLAFDYLMSYPLAGNFQNFLLALKLLLYMAINVIEMSG